MKSRPIIRHACVLLRANCLVAVRGTIWDWIVRFASSGWLWMHSLSHSSIDSQSTVAIELLRQYIHAYTSVKHTPRQCLEAMAAASQALLRKRPTPHSHVQLPHNSVDPIVLDVLHAMYCRQPANDIVKLHYCRSGQGLVKGH
jgi:hypothetical protein